MPKVYIVQEMHNHNYTPAGQFGELETLLPPNRQIMFNSQPVVLKLRDRLREFSDEDYILASGDPAAIGLVCAIAAERNHGKFKMLKWDRQSSCYYEVSLDIFPH